MSDRKVTVVIDQTGNGKVDMEGFNGTGCGELAARLSQAIGGTVQETNKPEFYETNNNEVSVSL